MSTRPSAAARTRTGSRGRGSNVSPSRGCAHRKETRSLTQRHQAETGDHRKQGPVPDVKATTLNVVQQLVQRREDGPLEVTFASELQDDLGLDSLELAELSAMLEEQLGRDPYTEGLVPQTVGEIVAFYER